MLKKEEGGNASKEGLVGIWIVKHHINPTDANPINVDIEFVPEHPKNWNDIKKTWRSLKPTLFLQQYTCSF